MLTVTNLCIRFSRSFGATLPQAIRHLDLEVRKGEIMAVVGESGSGKSLLAHALLGILPANAEVSGSIRYDGQELTPACVRNLRGKNISLIPQSVAYLNPFRTVGGQVERAAVLAGTPVAQARDARNNAFMRYGLQPGTAAMFAHQLSGGMARRVLSATATTGQAELIIADEPTTGLDQNAIDESLGQLRELADKGRAVLLITHDIAAALTVSDRVAVFLRGTVVEVATAKDFSSNTLRHPYTRALWQALPQHDFGMDTTAEPSSHDSITITAGSCPYAPDCDRRSVQCAAQPQLRELRQGLVRCHHA